MVRPSAGVRYSYADYLTFPDDGNRYEIIDGTKYATPAPKPRHQVISGELEFALRTWLEPRGGGLILHAPIDVVLADDTVVQPDILFVVEERRHIVGENALTAAPDLVVEILSPSTRRRDQTLKRERYARAGVREYWIVDPESRRVAVHVLEAGRLERVAEYAEGEMASAAVLPGFRMPLERLFRE